MTALMISTDRQAFEVGGAVRRRLVSYGDLVDKLEVIIFAKKTLGFRPVEVSERVSLYPTNSLTQIGYLLSAYKLGRNLPRPDLITCQDPFETGLVGLILAWRFKSRLEIQIHTDLFSPAFAEQSWLNKLRVGLAKLILPRADQVRVVSQRIKNSLVGAGLVLKSEPIILPIFSDSLDFQPVPNVDLHQAYPQFDKIILAAGRFTVEKRFDLAIKAFAILARDDSGAGLIIAGDGPLKDKLKSLVKRLKLGKRVVFLGWVNNLSGLYKSADAFILTSAYEGYGLVLVDAAAVGLPIVSTDVGVARESGATIAVATPEGLAQGLKIALKRGFNPNPRDLPIVSREEYLAALKQAWTGR